MWKTQVWYLGQEDYPGEGNDYLLQYSWLKNSMDRGAWQATVQGVTKSWIWLLSLHKLVYEIDTLFTQYFLWFFIGLTEYICQYTL